MNSLIKLFPLFLLLLSLSALVQSEECTDCTAECTQAGTTHLFYSTTCPHCKNEIAFLKELEKEYPQLTIHYMEAAVNQEEFKAFARQMARLKPYGRVDVSINNLAQKADFIIPEGGSPWHEYASCNGCVHAFFPDIKLAPYLPSDFVNKNRKLLLAKSSLIRESGMGATWRSTDPLFLPETFFEKYPHLRGPRVDHPRRSLKQEFTACFHQKETVEIYQNMVNQLFENVPEINSFSFNINDAGSGLCWSDLLYTGPNGPAGEKDIPISESAVTILNIFKSAANKIAGHEVEIFYGNMLTAEEIDDFPAPLAGALNPRLQSGCQPSSGKVHQAGGYLQALQNADFQATAVVFASERPRSFRRPRGKKPVW